MKLRIQAVNFEASANLEAHMEKKLKKLEKF